MWLSLLVLVAPATSLHFSSVTPNANQYYWPSARGQVGRFGVSEYAGPRDLEESLAWYWHHPEGRFHTVLFGTTIDDESNIYLTCAEGLRKFSPDGKLIWEYKRTQPGYTLKGEITASASMYDGLIYSSTTACELFAVDMKTGEETWVTNTSATCGYAAGFTSAVDNVVITATNQSFEALRQTVKGFNAKDGSELWSFDPDFFVRSFSPNFIGDGTFVFQDIEGGVYRHRIADGSRVWMRRGQVVQSWSDGQVLAGTNGIVYAVANTKNLTSQTPDDHGLFCAYKLTDGEKLWCTETPRPIYGTPSMGKVAGHDGLAVVVPMGMPVVPKAPTEIHAYDAETGSQLWVFEGPAQNDTLQRGELEGMQERAMSRVRPLNMGLPWSVPTIDADGTVYIGSSEGPLFALRNEDGNSVVNGTSEVASMDALACFPSDSAPSFAPGMMAMSTLDTLYVFKKE